MSESRTPRVNQVVLGGNLTGDPKLWPSRKEGGNSVLAFRMAMNQSWRVPGEEHPRTRTDFANVKVFGRHTEKLAEMLGKGTGVVIVGAWASDNYEKDDGTKVESYYVNALSVQIVCRMKPRSGEDAPDLGGRSGEPEPGEHLDDIPF